ncbi:uncharacterized protein UBRO_01409 [Ustilago bromivora]|uniref:Uncharacterized protein n=1 Tax=Ustilago bromivora TaxID=307758 RepID=A0A1K0FYQ7_9BASI|nr:uncharacterized protein UBRO_01409 [Ustilago bromivora]
MDESSRRSVSRPATPAAGPANSEKAAQEEDDYDERDAHRYEAADDYYSTPFSSLLKRPVDMSQSPNYETQVAAPVVKDLLEGCMTRRMPTIIQHGLKAIMHRLSGRSHHHLPLYQISTPRMRPCLAAPATAAEAIFLAHPLVVITEQT